MDPHPTFQHLFADIGTCIFLQGSHLWTGINGSEFAFKRSTKSGGHGPRFLVVLSQFIGGF